MKNDKSLLGTNTQGKILISKKPHNKSQSKNLNLTTNISNVSSISNSKSNNNQNKDNKSNKLTNTSNTTASTSYPKNLSQILTKTNNSRIEKNDEKISNISNTANNLNSFVNAKDNILLSFFEKSNISLNNNKNNVIKLDVNINPINKDSNKQISSNVNNKNATLDPGKNNSFNSKNTKNTIKKKSTKTSLPTTNSNIVIEIPKYKTIKNIVDNDNNEKKDEGLDDNKKNNDVMYSNNDLSINNNSSSMLNLPNVVSDTSISININNIMKSNISSDIKNNETVSSAKIVSKPININDNYPNIKKNDNLDKKDSFKLFSHLTKDNTDNKIEDLDIIKYNSGKEHNCNLEFPISQGKTNAFSPSENEILEQHGNIIEESKDLIKRIKSENDNIKLFLKKDKIEYNRLIKDYNNLNEEIIKNESSENTYNKQIEKFQTNNSLILRAIVKSSTLEKQSQEEVNSENKSNIKNNKLLNKFKKIIKLKFSSQSKILIKSISDIIFLGNRDLNSHLGINEGIEILKGTDKEKNLYRSSAFGLHKNYSDDNNDNLKYDFYSKHELSQSDIELFSVIKSKMFNELTLLEALKLLLIVFFHLKVRDDNKQYCDYSEIMNETMTEINEINNNFDVDIFENSEIINNENKVIEYYSNKNQNYNFIISNQEEVVPEDDDDSETQSAGINPNKGFRETKIDNNISNRNIRNNTNTNNIVVLSKREKTQLDTSTKSLHDEHKKKTTKIYKIKNSKRNSNNSFDYDECNEVEDEVYKKNNNNDDETDSEGSETNENYNYTNVNNEGSIDSSHLKKNILINLDYNPNPMSPSEKNHDFSKKANIVKKINVDSNKLAFNLILKEKKTEISSSMNFSGDDTNKDNLLNVIKNNNTQSSGTRTINKISDIVLFMGRIKSLRKEEDLFSLMKSKIEEYESIYSSYLEEFEDNNLFKSDFIANLDVVTNNYKGDSATQSIHNFNFVFESLKIIYKTNVDKDNDRLNKFKEISNNLYIIRVILEVISQKISLISKTSKTSNNNNNNFSKIITNNQANNNSNNNINNNNNINAYSKSSSNKTLNFLDSFSPFIELISNIYNKHFSIVSLRKILSSQQELLFKKNKTFLHLKELESQILLNDSIMKTNIKIYKQCTDVAEKIKTINLNNINKNNISATLNKIKDINTEFQIVKNNEFGKAQRKVGNINSLTLKSEFSACEDLGNNNLNSISKVKAQEFQQSGIKKEREVEEERPIKLLEIRTRVKEKNEELINSNNNKDFQIGWGEGRNKTEVFEIKDKTIQELTCNGDKLSHIVASNNNVINVNPELGQSNSFEYLINKKSSSEVTNLNNKNTTNTTHIGVINSINNCNVAKKDNLNNRIINTYYVDLNKIDENPVSNDISSNNNKPMQSNINITLSNKNNIKNKIGQKTLAINLNSLEKQDKQGLVDNANNKDTNKADIFTFNKVIPNSTTNKNNIATNSTQIIKEKNNSCAKNSQGLESLLNLGLFSPNTNNNSKKDCIPIEKLLANTINTYKKKADNSNNSNNEGIRINSDKKDKGSRNSSDFNTLTVNKTIFINNSVNKNIRFKSVNNSVNFNYNNNTINAEASNISNFPINDNGKVKKNNALHESNSTFNNINSNNIKDNSKTIKSEKTDSIFNNSMKKRTSRKLLTTNASKNKLSALQNYQFNNAINRSINRLNNSNYKCNNLKENSQNSMVMSKVLDDEHQSNAKYIHKTNNIFAAVPNKQINLYDNKNRFNYNSNTTNTNNKKDIVFLNSTRSNNSIKENNYLSNKISNDVPINTSCNFTRLTKNSKMFTNINNTDTKLNLSKYDSNLNCNNNNVLNANNLSNKKPIKNNFFDFLSPQSNHLKNNLSSNSQDYNVSTLMNNAIKEDEIKDQLDYSISPFNKYPRIVKNLKHIVVKVNDTDSEAVCQSFNNLNISKNKRLSKNNNSDDENNRGHIKNLDSISNRKEINSSIKNIIKPNHNDKFEYINATNELLCDKEENEANRTITSKLDTIYNDDEEEETNNKGIRIKESDLSITHIDHLNLNVIESNYLNSSSVKLKKTQRDISGNPNNSINADMCNKANKPEHTISFSNTFGNNFNYINDCNTTTYNNANGNIININTSNNYFIINENSPYLKEALKAVVKSKNSNKNTKRKKKSNTEKRKDTQTVKFYINNDKENKNSDNSKTNSFVNKIPNTKQKSTKSLVSKNSKKVKKTENNEDNYDDEIDFDNVDIIQESILDFNIPNLDRTNSYISESLMSK